MQKLYEKVSGNKIDFPKISVGATENAIMALY